ncbi:alanine--tRNA ligase [Methanoplanus endosymbiosus]|uniref:Alanine--tRNA ligase n=1 Tax=Methanoplanus endosymbiosus TaxID=33865 RepID=A0A9E7TIT1_9EURY|nr:alanine--tRNA ligase [Methanoplanus endosymbiosus]UUX92893.1 alanine--tRNA ligase [Methanoplanus endosymbiosus]
MLEEEYQLEYFKEKGFVRKICSKCGSAFWTRDPERETCGDAPCVPYDFIGKPVFEPHSISEMREKYLSFFEGHGHKRIERYPVAARWRDDIYLTIASIADFQPFVTSGVVPPPANPLTISQPCIRLNDLDSVGRSGRHLTTFEMMAHHAFNTPREEIYWKDRTVGLCDEFLASIGADINDITYKEHPWIGGGNAGPSVEVLIGGLEVATLVFMSLGKAKSDKPPVELEGVPYYPMDLRIVDTGYGLERLVWASKGSPTIYDAVFPEIVNDLMGYAGIDHFLDDPEFTNILGLNAKYAGLMDITGSNLISMRKEVANNIGVTFEKLQSIMDPVERIYAIADHTRCLAYMLGDCIVPSNAHEGYLARLVIRRTLRMMNETGMEVNLADLVAAQMKTVGLDSFSQDMSIVEEIIGNEIVKYDQTMARGRRIVQKIAREHHKNNESVPLNEIVRLYDSHGIPPEIVKEVSAEEGAEVDLPDNFYSAIADLHSETDDTVKEDPFAEFRERIDALPPTKKLFYEQVADTEFDAMVIDQFDDYIVLDQTLFYPEGGGQPSDIGRIISDDVMVKVIHSMKVGDVILHKVKGDPVRRGVQIKGIVDESFRWTMMRHHTATHVLLCAAREVLGKHIHQSGAQKGFDSSRIDLRHFRHITPSELKKIEIAANRIVLQNIQVIIEWKSRTKAEQKYGFDLYQGGVPPGKKIRIVRVADDIQACAGTHCRSTGEIGSIKIIRVEHVQDGIERVEFSAGLSAISYMQGVEDIADTSAATLSVQRENLPQSVDRFFSEWKEQRKDIEKLQKELADLRINSLSSEDINGIPVAVHELNATPRELMTVATSFANKGGVGLIIGGEEKLHVVAASGTDDVDASEVVKTVCNILGGRGGGKKGLAQGVGNDRMQLGNALSSGKELITRLLK